MSSCDFDRCSVFYTATDNLDMFMHNMDGGSSEDSSLPSQSPSNEWSKSAEPTHTGESSR